MMRPKAMRHWLGQIGWWAWFLMAATAVFSAALTLVLAEAVLERLVAAGGVWGVVPFVVAVAVIIAGVFALLRGGFGRGSLLGSRFGVPPTWLSAVLAVLIFWEWPWSSGPSPHHPVDLIFISILQPADAVFTHGWAWLWGSVISCGVASAIWQAVLPRLLAHYGERLRVVGWLGRELTPLPVDDASPRAGAMRCQQQEAMEAIFQGIRREANDAGATVPIADASRATARGCANGQNTDVAANVSDSPMLPQSGPTGDEIVRWLQGNDEPLRPGERDLLRVTPSPRRVLASLRPTHQYGNARTLAVIGQRGGGKSSLLRLTGRLPEAKSEVELRFVYLSLWEYQNAQAAMQAAIKDVLRVVRDRIDILPFTGAAGAFARAMAGEGRYHWLSEALGLRTSSEELFGALSAILLVNNLRVIICIEDDDRLADASQKKLFVNLITGSIDFIRQFPAFGYALCVKSNDWTELHRAALNKVEPSEQRRERSAKIGQALEELAAPGQQRETVAGSASEPQVQSDQAHQTPPRTTPSADEGKSGSKPPENSVKSQILKDIEVQRRAATAAAKRLLDSFDTSRLCREELVILPLAPEQWKPLLERVRERMFQSIEQDPRAGCLGLVACYADGQQNAGQTYAGGRQLVWNALIEKLTSAPFTMGRPMPEFGLANAEPAGFSFTPRSLRRGLGDAWRKWLAIKPILGNKIVVDPDSVLIACLVRACRPDVWNILIRDESLLLGGDWPTTNYLVQHVINRQDVAHGQMVRVNQFDQDQWGYAEAFPHLGLSQEIINIMRKSCVVPDLSRARMVQGTTVPEMVEEPFLPTAVRAHPSHDVPKIKVVRPGGLIGSLPEESNPGSNWRIFLNA